jgi:hypothetical protein
VKETIFALRRWLFALLALGLMGLGTELILLEHYEELWMRVPLVAIGLGLAALLAVAVVGTPVTLRVFQLVMASIVALGGIGVALHYQGSAEFQREMDPTLSGWPLAWKVLHMKAPPTIAPGALAQLGLLGLIATYGHPARIRTSSSTGD